MTRCGAKQWVYASSAAGAVLAAVTTTTMLSAMEAFQSADSRRSVADVTERAAISDGEHLFEHETFGRNGRTSPGGC
jgi:hypothetical protein